MKVRFSPSPPLWLGTLMACTKNFSYRSMSAISLVFSCSRCGFMKWGLTTIPVLQALWWLKLPLPWNTWVAIMEWLSWSSDSKHLKCSNWKCYRCSAQSHLPAVHAWEWGSVPTWHQQLIFTCRWVQWDQQHSPLPQHYLESFAGCAPFWGDSRLFQIPRCLLCKTEDPWKMLK